MREVQTVTVLGSGTMGNGIAQVCAMHGLDVRMQDVDDDALERARTSIGRSLDRMVRSERFAESEVSSTLERITATTDLYEAIDAADFVIEAVPERMDLKEEIFARCDELTDPDVVLASNTSNFSITAIASTTEHPERVIGMHWFNPPPVMRLIEIVDGLQTSSETLAATEELADRIGKETVVCKDAQGFITTRAVIALSLECFRMLEEGVASKEDIDKAVRLGLNHPMGPLELADLTGLDINLHVAEAMTETYGERFRAPNVLRNHVRAGRLGRKTGRGLYEYDED